MKRLYYVDFQMCGGRVLPEDFDLDEFCEVLQGKVGEDIEIVALTEEERGAENLDSDLISTAVFEEALGEYCHR